jgi:hypothetical protein
VARTPVDSGLEKGSDQQSLRGSGRWAVGGLGQRHLPARRSRRPLRAPRCQARSSSASGRT